jgi:hypothetical protein
MVLAVLAALVVVALVEMESVGFPETVQQEQLIQVLAVVAELGMVLADLEGQA